MTKVDAVPTVNVKKRNRLKSMAALCAVSLFMSPLFGTPAAANAIYPDKPLKIIVNFPGGGPIDIIARLVAKKLQTSLGQPVVVENQTGAAGNIGARAVAKAQPDGYTILFSIDTPFTLSPSVYSSMPFNVDELKPLVLIGSSGLTIAVNPKKGITTLEGLIAKGKQDEITFSSAGNGSPGHIAALMFADATGVHVNHIPYRGNPPAVLALISGEVQAGILSTSGLLPQIEDSKLTPLAIASSQRSALLPSVPTATELGYPGVELEFLFLVMAPSKTPNAIVKILQDSIREALGDADIQDRLRILDIASSDIEASQVAAKLSTFREHYAKTIKANNLKFE